ncbi:MAG: hypothetical protein QM757_35485 [Paludibaculum sp.]
MKFLAHPLQRILQPLLLGERVRPAASEARDFRSCVGLAQARQFPQAAEDVDAHGVAGERLAAGERRGGP